MIQITTQPIDTAQLLRQVGSPDAGAVVLFLGTTREMTQGRRTLSLDYECYPEMARAKLAELESEARARWALAGCMIVHRVGHLEIGEASVAVAVSTAHRQAAFEAGQWLIDRLKKTVPIWKKENWADGESAWVHPGLDVPTYPSLSMGEGGERSEPGEGEHSEPGGNRSVAPPHPNPLPRGEREPNGERESKTEKQFGIR